MPSMSLAEESGFVAEEVEKEEDWGELTDEQIVEPNAVEKKSAIAPSVREGKKKFLGMLRRNSDDYIFNVAWRTARATVRVNGVRIPAGLLSPAEFWVHSLSFRVFLWGLTKHFGIYPNACWEAPGDGTYATPCVAGTLRRVIVSFDGKKSLPEVKKVILTSLVAQGIVKSVPFTTPCKDVRLVVNSQRMRKAFQRCLFLVRIGFRQATPAKPPAAKRSTSGRESPSLKRRCVC